MEGNLDVAVEHLEMLRRQFPRPALQMVLDKALEPDAPTASWFGKVRVALPDEEWPTTRLGPMIPICQINCLELPLRPKILHDVALFTVFFSNELLDDMATGGESDGVTWLLREYSSLDGLKPIEEPELSVLRVKRPHPVRWEQIVDYPSIHDVVRLQLLDRGLSSQWAEKYGSSGEYANVFASKIDGWPSLDKYGPIHFEYPAWPEFFLQLVPSDEAGWHWLDGGIAYIGRLAGPQWSDWVLGSACG